MNRKTGTKTRTLLKRTIRPLLILAVLSLCLPACSPSRGDSQAGSGRPVVRAVFTDKEINVDGRDDAVWREAPTTRVKMLKTGEIVEVKVLYTNQRIYLKADYPDASHDYIDRPWVFNGAAWKQQGQQDSLAVIWNVNDSIRGFNERGFSVLTKGLGRDMHPWELEIEGGSLSEAPKWFKSQLGDFWAMGLQLPYGKAEDWSLRADTSQWKNDDWHLRILNQHDHYTDGVPWVLNKDLDWTGPIWMLKPGMTLETNPYPVEADMVDITGHAPAAGEQQPFIVYESREARWGDSKDDIDGAESWSDGRWTTEFARKLATGHNDDIQFEPDLGREYSFGLLVRRDGSRYEPTGPVTLVFEPK